MGAESTEEQTGAPQPGPASVPQPPQFFRGEGGRIRHRPPAAEQRPPLLSERLQRLRRKAEGIKSTVVLLIMLMFVVGIALNVGFSLFGRYFASAGFSDYLLPALAIMIPVGILLLGYYYARLVANRAFLRSHGRCREALRYTQLALMVSDEQYWHQLFELQRESPWLKWAQVNPPQTIEQHLEFAAAYHSSLLQLATRPGLLNGRTVTRGNCAWHAGRPTCYVCGFLAGYGCSIFALVYDWFALSGMLAKAGRLAALCDYFLGDFELLPQAQRAAEATRAQLYRDSLALTRGLPAAAALEEQQRTAAYRSRLPLPPSEHTYADAMRQAALLGAKPSDPPEPASPRSIPPTDETAAE